MEALPRYIKWDESSPELMRPRHYLLPPIIYRTLFAATARTTPTVDNGSEEEPRITINEFAYHLPQPLVRYFIFTKLYSRIPENLLKYVLSGDFLIKSK